MRVASYYPDVKTVGRNDGPPLFHTYWLRQIFGDANVMHLLPLGDLSMYGKFDLNYWVDFGDDAIGLDKFVCPKPNVYITSDTHLGYEYRLRKAREFDYVLCNQYKAMQDFIKDGIPEDRCLWLPHAFDPMAYSPGCWNSEKNDFDREAVPMKRYDVCFIGNMNDANRANHVDKLFKAFPNFYYGNQRFHQASEKFNQSKIVFNVSSRKELNMRHFEALGSGAFLLSDNIPEDENVFKEGYHFVGYDNTDEMIDKAKFYLEHDSERERIARNGYEEAISYHTYLHRVLAVLDVAGVEYDRELARSWLPSLRTGEPAGAV